MAVTGFWPIYKNLKATLDYADNPDKTTAREYLDDDLYAALSYAENDNKTDRKMYVGGINCSKQNAYVEMIAVQHRFGLRGKVVGYHGIQSFKTGEVTPEQAFEIGKATARKMWGDRYQVLVTVHLNTENAHCHFVVNPVSFKDGTKFQNKIGDHKELRCVSDEMCREHGLSVLENSSFYGGHKKDYWRHKSGKQYHYYMCKKARKKKCNKKIISKDYIEDRVVSECLKMLTDEKIRYIAKKVAEECNKSPDNISVREIKKAIKEVDTAIENLWKGIEQGQAVDMLTERLHQRQVEKEELETQLAIENNKKICLSEAQILAFLDYVCEMPLDDFNKRRAIINIFVHSIYLYDDHFTLIINASKKPLSIENIPLDDIEEAFEGENTETEGCSSMMTPAPPSNGYKKDVSQQNLGNTEVFCI